MTIKTVTSVASPFAVMSADAWPLCRPWVRKHGYNQCHMCRMLHRKNVIQGS